MARPIHRILIVYNFTKHLVKITNMLERAIENPRIDIVRRTHVAEKNSADYDLIILTGGNGRDLLFDEDKLKAQKSIITRSATPIIGICFGAELIAQTLGANLQEMRRVRRWYIPIRFVRETELAPHRHPIKVYEGHKIKISQLPDELEVLAVSKDGVEVFRHRRKQIYGLQFHPEYAGRYDHGEQIFENIVRAIELRRHD